MAHPDPHHFIARFAAAVALAVVAILFNVFASPASAVSLTRSVDVAG